MHTICLIQQNIIYTLLLNCSTLSSARNLKLLDREPVNRENDSLIKMSKR